MKPLRIKVRDVDEVVEMLLVEDRGAGVDIRVEGQSAMTAGSSATVDMPVNHCSACASSIADQIGLSDDELTKIVAWRHRKEHGWSAAEVGAILDKIVKRLDYIDDKCSDETSRLVLEVEDA